MGGAQAGEVASKMGVDLVLDYFRKSKESGAYAEAADIPDDISPAGRHLWSAIQQANSAIFDAGQKNDLQQGMGTTIVAAFFHDDGLLTLAHAGDSRVYRVRNGGIEQLTQDHSLVAEQVRRGMMSAEQAERSELQNIIIRALGSEQTLEPEVQDLLALQGDVYLLATDGLTKLVKPESLKTIIEASSLDNACEQLIQAAKDQGGDDNITCLLLRVVERPWYHKLFEFARSGGN
jgi:protein phosphatase